MRGKKYQALIVAILLLTALPYSPFLSRASNIDNLNTLENDGTPPFRDSDGDGLSDDYEISLGFDPNDFDMDNDGISDMAEMDFWNDLVNEDFVPPNMEDLYDCEGDLDGDGITNCMDQDADGDGIPDAEEMLDSDGDGIPDMYENMIDHLDPQNPDSDGDGIPDMEDDDPPLPEWAETMSKNNDWTPQPDANGMNGGLEGFYPLAMLAAVKFIVECDTCEEPTANPKYWRTVAKDIYDNGYDPVTDTYSRSQWCPSPGCEQYGIESGIIENPGYWSTGETPFTYDYLVTNPEITSQQYTYTMTWVMPVQGYLSTALNTNDVFITNLVTMDSAFNLKVDGYATSYTFTITEYSIPDSVKQAANAPDDFSSQLIELPTFPSRPGENNDIYDLATSITEGKTTDYEKAEAIMYYLRNNYYYNINGTLTPDGDDYIDYFLFGNPGQDGKCTNFASAFTALARLNNIPTRYVEGNGGGSIVTPEEWESSGYGSSTGYTIEEDTRVVTMLNGHAYAEVLLDGIGWLIFEPTSSNICPTCDSNAALTTGEDDTVVGDGTQPGTDYEINDSDGDGLSDEYEEGIGTDPFNMDTDGDTLPDGAETDDGIYVNNEYTGTSPLNPDTDNDGLDDNEEILCLLSISDNTFCSNPFDSDTDNDGLTDGDEYYIHGTNPRDNDEDNDGLLDGLEIGVSINDIWEEIEHNLPPCETKSGAPIINCLETWQPDEDPESTTDPFNPDSDGDGIEDGIEDLNRNGKVDFNSDEDPCNDETDPTLADTDAGGRDDFEECEIDSTNPRDPTDDIRDSDGDGLFDHIEEENCVYGTAQNQCTNSTIVDTDEDGISDYDEIFNCFYGKNNDQCTDPVLEDTDGDTLLDNVEITNCIYGENNNECTDPMRFDTDEGGANDGLEIITDFTNPLEKSDDIQQKDRDDDEDGLTNAEEDINQNGILDSGETDPNNPDTDGDGLSDGEEVTVQHTDPRNVDSDDDGLTDGEEILNQTWGPTDPNDSDTDDDGLNDGEEIGGWIYCADEGEYCDFNGAETVRYGFDETWTSRALIDGTACNNAVFGDPLPGISKECYYGSEGYGTNPTASDTDGDGLNDGDEVNIHDTDPTNTDTDNDQLNDNEEINTYDTDPNNKDSDSDGLNDGDEVNIHDTDPNLEDSDSDGLNDGNEINIHDTDPNLEDSDSDGLNDWDELFNTTWGPTDPNNSDTDDGGQKDGLEVIVDGTDPNDGSDDDLSNFDDDEDGLTNGEEENIYFTDPNDPDTDGDGLEDGDEVNNWATDPLKTDSDYDGIEDGTETTNCIYGENNDECTSPSDDDSDNDGLEDGDEILVIGSDPKDTDTDDDELSDGDEVNNCNYGEDNDECTSLIDEDSDGDGLNDGEEVSTYLTDPMDSDTDGDEINDGDEVNNCNYGENNNECTNPNNPDSDGDGLTDGDEVNSHGSDPKDTDTDDDELTDGTEITNCIYGEDEDECTSPINDDSDDDGINDHDEIFNFTYGENGDERTDPRDSDSDGDGLTDGDEVNSHGSDPKDNDSDDDGIEDGTETTNCVYGEENKECTSLIDEDSDDDGLNDYDEVNNCIYGQNNTGSDCTDPMSSDSDSDRINDWLEITLTGTDPMDSDSDNDDLNDGQETGGLDGNNVSHGHGATDPLDHDSDNGGVKDGTEINTDDTNPNNPSDDFIEALDNDGDGLSNGDEVNTHETDPNDPDSDDDGLIDGDEVTGLNNTYGYTSDPNDFDSDDDGINDYDEVNNCFYGEDNNQCTNPEDPDSDNDEINDYDEINTCTYGPEDDECTDPNLEDSDSDGLNDGEEINTHETDPKNDDSDNDGLNDGNETNVYNSDPNDSDSDDDGINDYDEINNCVYGENNDECTDPNEFDSDDDGINDYDEINNCVYGENNDECTDPNEFDSDDDGINDYDEINNCVYGENNDECTDPNEFDSDDDGINDYDEITTHNTDPMNSDSDNDELNDGFEINNLESNPLSNDSDSDGLDDYWEWSRSIQGYLYSLNSNDTDSDGTLDGDEDLDNDGLGNLDEIQGNNADNYITDPLERDTDGDGLYDGDEIDPQNINKDGINNQYNYPSNPLDPDSDDDLLTDLQEVLPSNDTYSSRTNPMKPDTDGDGRSDGEEISYYWNTTSNNATYLVYYNVSGEIDGWQTSDPKEKNTDGDAWEDGDENEVNPVYGYYEEEDPPWGSPPSRAGTAQEPPAVVYKNQEFIWSFNMINASSGEPYVGVQIDAYINETEAYGSPSYKIGNGTTDSEGFVEVICNGSSLSSTIRAGDWFIQLHRPEQFIEGDNTSIRIIESWSPTLNLTIIGNSTIVLDVPEDFTGASGQNATVTGKLFEDNNIPIKDVVIDLIVQDIGSYSTTTNEDGSFAITIELPETEDEKITSLFFEYEGNENITETAVTDAIRVINASIDFEFDENNANSLELNQTYTIRGIISGDELQEPTGTIELDYSGIELGNISITGNENWEINVTIPENSTWGEAILKATYSGDGFHPASIIVSEVIVKGASQLTLERIESLRSQNIKLEGNLTDHNGEAIPDYTINLYLDGEIIGSAVTNSEGRYSFSGKDFSQEAPGLHTISAILLESETLFGNTVESEITLLASPSLVYDSVTKCENTEDDDGWECKSKRNTGYNLSGILIDELGNPLSGVEVYIDEEIPGYVDITTGDNGQFYFSIPLSEDEIDLTIQIDENSITDSLDIDVKLMPQAEIEIILNVNNAHRGENVTITGEIQDEDERPVTDYSTFVITIDGKDYTSETENGITLVNGTFTLSHTLSDNYKLGEDVAVAKFGESTICLDFCYLGNQTNATFLVYGSTSFESVTVVGDLFDGRIKRGGEITVTGILVDDLGNRLNGNITAKIGNEQLSNATFTNDTTFISTGIVPQIYRNNHTLELKYEGTEDLLGNVILRGASDKIKVNVLVKSVINIMVIEPSIVYGGNQVNFSIVLEEDDGTPLPHRTIKVTKTDYFNEEKGLKNESIVWFITETSGDLQFNFSFPTNAESVTIEIEYSGGYIENFYDTPQEAEFTAASKAISITKATPPSPPLSEVLEKYIPLFIGIPAALLVTGYYMYWTQKHKYEVRNLIKQMQKELNKDEDYRQIIIKSYHQLLNILSRYGFIKTRTQTVREFTDVMARALPIPEHSVKVLTSLFEIARYSGIKPKVVDEFGMEMIDGSYNIWCVEAINNLHQVETDLNTGLKQGKVSRFTNIFGMRSGK